MRVIHGHGLQAWVILGALVSSRSTSPVRAKKNALAFTHWSIRFPGFACRWARLLVGSTAHEDMGLRAALH